MRPFPLTVMQGGINRLRVKGAARPNMVYDLLNAYITNAGSIQVRDGTIRDATLAALQTAGLMAMDNVLHVFATSEQSVPAGYTCDLLIHPTDSTQTLAKIWFAKPFMGFPYVVAQFSNGDIFTYWLQSSGTWQPDTPYTTSSIVTPDTPNGLAYQATRVMAQNPLWTAQTTITAGTLIEPTNYTGFAYRAVAVSSSPGTSAFTGSTEPAWPTVVGGTIQEFGNFNTTSADTSIATGSTGASPLSINITDRYGDSSDIAGQAGTASNVTVLPTAAQVVQNWQPGTLYAPGAVVKPGTNQGAFINAIPNGDFESGDDGNWVKTAGASITTGSGGAVPYQGLWFGELVCSASTETLTMNTFGTVTAGQAVTASAYVSTDASGSALESWINLLWYNSSGTFISKTQSAGQHGNGNTNNYQKLSVTGNAPATATKCRVQLESANGSSTRTSQWDLVTWSLEQPAAVSNFLYEAVQASAGTSGSTQPTWPVVAGDDVTDGTVTWQAIGTSIITWQAIPIMLSGGQGIVATVGTIVAGTLYTTGTYTSVPLTGGTGTGALATVVVAGGGVTTVTITFGGGGYVVGDTLSANNTNIGGTGSGFSCKVATLTGNGGEPTFPTTIGANVYDPSQYTSTDGHVTNTSMSWTAINRMISDSNCPNNPATCLGASHAFEGNDDICSYSAAVNPTDWSTTNNAGYLPTGLNNYGDNPIKVLALYRSNLMVFNASGYQMWQIDPDPQNMALLDAQPIGSIYTQSAQSVANDLIFMTEVGVRNIGTVGATANMQIGNTGQPIDPLVIAQLEAGTYQPLALYYPGRGQYMVFFGAQAFVLTVNGAGIRSWSRYTFPDVVTDWTIKNGVLYLRSAGNLIWKLDADTLLDDVHATVDITGSVANSVLTVSAGNTNAISVGMTVIAEGVTPGTTITGGSGSSWNVSAANTVVATSESMVLQSGTQFTGVIQWPYLDNAALGVNKGLIGIDLVGDGALSIQIAYREDDPTTFSDNAGFSSSLNVTAPYAIEASDTLPGNPIPIPVVSPSYSLVLTYLPGQFWDWDATNFYLDDQRGRGF